MDIRADLTVPAQVTAADWQWVDSPQPGVSRVMLDRTGDEVAVATSFVRYAPDSHFPGHDHALGEEFIVLEGEFGDAAGRYPAGTYVRNPPGSHHVPFSEPGCLIWVKLRQFDTADQRQMSTLLDGQQTERLVHEHAGERVRVMSAAAGEEIHLTGSEEVQEALILEGEAQVDGISLPKWSWIRIPAGHGASLACISRVCVFSKTRPVYR